MTSGKACILHVHHGMGGGPTSLDVLLLPAEIKVIACC